MAVQSPDPPETIDLGAEGRLVTDRLVLRGLTVADAEDVALYLDDWQRARKGAILRGLPSIHRARLLVAQADGGWRAGNLFTLAIERENDGVFLGATSLGVRSGPFRRYGDIGYWLGRPHWGRGYALEAIRAMLALAHGHLRLTRCQAAVYSDNTQSIRVLDKAGFSSMHRAGETGLPFRRRRILRYFRVLP